MQTKGIRNKGVIHVDLEEQFNKIARKYDENRRKFIPCFDAFYLNTTDFITSNIDSPKRIVDLGAGTGLLTYYWYQQFSNAEYVLVDIADEMLSIARERFAHIDHISYEIGNYIHKLPDAVFDAVISALSIHHLENREKQHLFSEIYDRLPQGGLFVNYDQFCAGQPELNHWYDTYWENQLADRGLSDEDLVLWKERRKLDRECSVEQEVEWLTTSGFTLVKCVYTCQKFSVIVAVK